MANQRATLNRGGLFFITIFSFLLTSCASTPQTSQLLAQQGDLPQHQELTEVTFFPQEKYQCGPAALATMFQNTGINIAPSDLVPEIYIPSRKGSLQIEILASSRRHGRVAYRIEPNLRALLSEVSAGNPVLVLQNLGLSWAPVWHFAVAVGFDLSSREIILRSGLDARHKTPLGTFERTWARSHYWGIVVLKPEQLPSTVKVDQYIKSVVPLEQVKRWKEANTAYQTALSRWPDNQIALMGLGNSYYQLKNLDSAETAFRKATEKYPDFAPAYNNLAQVLLERGKILEAKTHAEKAISLGGPQLEMYKATLQEIQLKSESK